VKARDAQALVDYMARPAPSASPAPCWQFPATNHWRKQFERDLADVPPLP